MIACTVRFETQSSGSVHTETVNGLLERKKTGIEVSYRISRDEARFHVRQGELSMERRGEFPIDARFLSGQDSAITVEQGGMKGEILIHTDSLYMMERPGRLRIFLKYRTSNTYRDFIRLKIFVDFLEVL